MKIKSLIFMIILVGLSCCRNVSSGIDSMALCNDINSQAMDSLISYKSSFSKKKSTLEYSLRLLNDAIKCDSNLTIAKFNKVTVLNEMGKHNEAINLIDELIVSQRDSSLLLIKAPIYDKLNDQDSLMITYEFAYRYFDNRLRDDPQNPKVIFGRIFSQSKIYGKVSVKAEIDLYLEKYPDDYNLKALLTEILNE